MTITLDDVYALFQILIVGTFFSPPYINHATTVHMFMDNLEVSEVVVKEFGTNKGFHLLMSLFRDRYEKHVEDHKYQGAAKAYMLDLVACTIFADKSEVYIDVRYLSLFNTLDTTCWTWGVTSLTMLYMELGVST